MSWLYKKRSVSQFPAINQRGYYRMLARVPFLFLNPRSTRSNEGAVARFSSTKIGGQPIFTQIRVRKNESWPRTHHSLDTHRVRERIDIQNFTIEERI